MQRELNERRDALSIVIEEKYGGKMLEMYKRFLGPPVTAEEAAEELRVQRNRKSEEELHRRDRMWSFVADAVGE